MGTINGQQVTYHPLSSHMKALLYYYQGELYRSPSHAYQPIMEAALRTGSKYIQTTIPTDLVYTHGVQTKQYGRELKVYKHKQFKHRVRIQEADKYQVLEFIRHICALNIALLSVGLIIIDIHEGNISDTIEGIKWWDLGAFSEATKDNLLVSYVLLNYLVHKYILKNFSGEHQQFNIDILRTYNNAFTHISNWDLSKPVAWDSLYEEARKCVTPYPESTWNSNYSIDMDFHNPKNPKAQAVDKIMGRLRAQTVTDVACNKGYYSFMAVKHGAKSVLGFDADGGCIQQARDFRVKLNQPVCFGCVDIEKIPVAPNGKERFGSELVLALAIVHHIKFSHEFFSDVLTFLSDKYILLEDIDTAAAYQGFLQTRGFRLVERVPSYPTSRTLSLYERS